MRPSSPARDRRTANRTVFEPDSIDARQFVTPDSEGLRHLRFGKCNGSARSAIDDKFGAENDTVSSALCGWPYSEPHPIEIVGHRPSTKAFLLNDESAIQMPALALGRVTEIKPTLVGENDVKQMKT